MRARERQKEREREKEREKERERSNHYLSFLFPLGMISPILILIQHCNIP
jgi:hypothetical protein